MQQPSYGLTHFKDQEYEPSMAQSNVKTIVSHSPYQSLLKQVKQYIPKSQIIDSNKLKQSPHLKLKKYRQSSYYGQIVNGKRHGIGIMFYNNDRVYEGQWQNDYKQGRGYQQFTNKAIYYGQYMNGKPQGKGKYTWNNGQYYEGQWLNGLKNGSGIWQGTRGDSYVGQWKMGKADGLGVHTWINGDRYQGQFKQCLKHGQGTQRFVNGDLYKGSYVKGKPEGYGQYYWSNGCYFKGNFKAGLRNGHGLWKKGPGNSDKYQGQYENDKKHGYGIFTWESGNVYKGNYQNELRHGYGEMNWSDGSYYKGQWNNGIQEGEGIMYVPKKGLKKGIFKDNVLVETQQQCEIKQSLDLPKFIKTTNHSKNPTINNSFEHNKDRYRKKTISLYQQPVNRNKFKSVNMRIYKGNKLNNKQQSIKNIPNNFQRIGSNNLQIMKHKDRIPHSSYYIHKMHKRVNTMTDQPNSRSYSRGNMADQMKNFTRKIVSRFNK